MNAITSKVALSALAVGVIPAMSLMAPFTTYAKTVNDLPTSVQDQIAEQKNKVIIDAAKLEQDQSRLSTAERDRVQLRDELLHRDADFEINRAETDNDMPRYDQDDFAFPRYELENNSEYRAARDEVANLEHLVRTDTEQLHYDANMYRGMLFNNDLTVPDRLSFISEDA